MSKGPRGVSFIDDDEYLVEQVNSLLRQLHFPTIVKNVGDIGAAVFVTIFEGLCGEKLTGLIPNPVTKEDEIHNCQIVINSLAGDVLHTSLNHISGIEVIEGSHEAIQNLTEIFHGLLEYILNKIDSDVSTDNDGESDREGLDEDPDAMAPDQIDRILESELHRERLLHAQRLESMQRPSAVWMDEPSTPVTRRKVGEGTTESPAKGGGDSTSELIKEGEELERKLKLEQEAAQRTRARVHEMQQETRRLEQDRQTDEHTEARGGTIREPSERDDILKRLENDPRYQYMLPSVQSNTPPRSKPADAGRADESFSSLQNMIEETAAMAEAAVNASPTRAKTMLQDLEAKQRRQKSRARAEQVLADREHAGLRYKSPSAKRASPSSQRRSPITVPQESDRLSDSELTPSRAKRKVSFLVDRSTTDSSPSIDKGRTRYAWEDMLEKRSAQKGAAGRPRSSGTDKIGAKKSSGSYLDLDHSDKENETFDDKLRRHFHEIVDDVLSDEEPGAARRPTRQAQPKTAPVSSQRGTLTVRDTQKMIQDEKKSGDKKIGFLQKIYREDLDELIDEANYELYQSRKLAKQTETDYQRKLKASAKPKTSQLTKTAAKPATSVLKKKHTPSKHLVSSKARKHTPSTGYITPLRPKKSPLQLQDDEDILPLLLEEFPHLHLSLHTWHELWRKGLNQIEQITRAHQEVKRKKSRAQTQLEEAEKRQEIMVNIMKKEIEHGQRLKEIKDRQATTVATRNRIHERRMQSARSRNYYDDYQVRMRSKMLKRRTREEMVFKKLFRDGLNIQKERIRELRKYAHEQRDGQAVKQRNEIESMENYYRDQFQMLAESISKEKHDLLVREKAQQKVLSQMKKEIRKKMESEIKLLQEQLVRDDDDAYFRQIDADRVIHDLQMAKYQTNV